VTLIAAAGGGGFDTALLAFGLLLAAGALLAGLAHRSFLSLTALFVLAGFVLGEGGLDVLTFDPASSFVADLAIVALVVILFRDGLEVEWEMLQTSWRLPLRKLVLAMPLTAAIVALGAHVLTDLGWTECFLLGALLAPTDPVLSSSVVTNPRVPRLARHSLNLESGMNDGLALPAVLAFTAALVGTENFVWWRFVLQDVGLGFAFGVAMGLLASLAVPARNHSLYGLGVAFATYGVTVLPPEGNGLIAVFTCAIVLGIRRPEVRDAFERDAHDVVDRRADAADREAGGDLDRPRGHRRLHGAEGVHGVVRPEGRGHHDVLPARAQLGLRG
jgi:NhaP-type Na+/H+ or K+/H+ antiporter